MLASYSRRKEVVPAPSPAPSVSSSSQPAAPVITPILPTTVCHANNDGLARQIRDKLNQVVFPNLRLEHFSLYAPPSEATYANDMLARFMKVPQFSLSHREPTRFKYNNAVIIGLQGSGTNTFTRHPEKVNGYYNPSSAPEVGTPWFPSVELQRPVLGLPGVEPQHFAKPLIEKAPIKDMCNLGIDENDELRYHLLPSTIIEQARLLLKTSAVPENEKQESPSKEKATMVLSCAKAVYHSLTLPGVNIDIQAFREELCRQSIALHMDLNSTRAIILTNKLGEGNDFRSPVPLHLVLLSTLIREWMLVAIIIAQTIIDPNMAITEIEITPAYEESAPTADPLGFLPPDRTETLPVFEEVESNPTPVHGVVALN